MVLMVKIKSSLVIGAVVPNNAFFESRYLNLAVPVCFIVFGQIRKIAENQLNQIAVGIVVSGKNRIKQNWAARLFLRYRYRRKPKREWFFRQKINADKNKKTR